jgi:hypothetical protein
VSDLALTDRIISQIRALVRASEALGTVEPTGPFERALARLRAIVKVVPTWVSEEMLSASEHTGDDRTVLWMSDNWPRTRTGAACCG